MMLVLSDHEAERKQLAAGSPRREDMAAMGAFNDELRDAGVLLTVHGLHPSTAGARVTFENGSVSVTDGPFAETKELVAGFWVLELASRDEAIAWARRVPFENGRVEIRQIAEWGDTGY